MYDNNFKFIQIEFIVQLYYTSDVGNLFSIK